MTSDRKLVSCKNKYWRRSEPLPGILAEWYGEEAASSEIAHHLPRIKKAGEIISDIMTKAGTPEGAFVKDLRENWAQVAGGEIAKFASPRNIRDGVLFIEVSSSPWLMELHDFEKKMLLEKIRGFRGGTICRNVRFVPAG